MTSKPRSEIRKRIRSERRALPPGERAVAAEQLTRRLAAHPLFMHSRRIAAYLPNDGELDPLPVMDRAFAMGKAVYLPVLTPNETGRLWFAPYRHGDALALNRFGIPEPVISPRRRAAITTLDLVLTPLVAFDPRGNRLGMGGGFYDRTFAFLRHRRHWQKPRLLGLAYEFQRVDTLAHQPWDVPLYGIATDQRLYLCD